MQASLLIKNAEIIFPDEGRINKGSLAVAEGKIYLVENLPDIQADTVIDASGLFVSPGFIDHHCHVFYGGTGIGFLPDTGSFPLGCTALADAGSVGASNFKAFYNDIVIHSRTKIFTYLNVASAGQVNEDSPEYANPQFFDKSVIKDLFGKYKQIRGLKLRFDKACVKDLGLKALEGAKQLACDFKVPLVVHVANHPDRIADIVNLLDKGDVVCHIYQNLCEGILDEGGKILKEVKAARERGVLFDSADGYRNNSFSIIKKAFAEGFLPDIISTDLTCEKLYTNRGYGLIYTMSKYLAAGMSLENVIKAVTATPFSCLGIHDLGIIKSGAAADICIFKLDDAGDFVFKDYAGEQIQASKIIRPLVTIAGGDIVFADFEMIVQDRIRK